VGANSTLDISQAPTIAGTTHVALNAGSTIAMTNSEAFSVVANQVSIGSIVHYTDATVLTFNNTLLTGSYSHGTLIASNVGQGTVTVGVGEFDTITGLAFGGELGQQATIFGSLGLDPVASLQNFAVSQSGAMVGSGANLTLNPSANETYGGSFSGSGTLSL